MTCEVSQLGKWKTRIPDHLENLIMTLRREGLTYNKIWLVTGVSYHGIHNVLKRRKQQ